MSWDQTKEFLSKVLVWPVAGAGYINLHYSMVNPRGATEKNIVTGKPFQNIPDLISFAQWMKGQGNFRDTWYCTSQQIGHRTNNAGKTVAVRLHQNATFLKAIWIDVDVGNEPGKPGKHYDTIEEAWAALTQFRKDAGLPQFSAVVKSGGGLHAYWIADAPLTPGEWKPYAEGLRALLMQYGVKCDAGLTTDDVRLLRLPNTLNHKYDPPRPVELLPLPLREYNFPTVLLFLTTVTPVAQISTVSTTQYFDPAVFPKRAPVSESLADGITVDAPPLSTAPIMAGCKFLSDALATGGKDYDNPLWNLTTLCATFMEDGETLAHQMSAGHTSYTHAETQAQYERKVVEREARGLGWPSCKTIQANGCTSCAGCPHFAKGKSPLNLGVTAAVTSAFSTIGAPMPANSATGDLPPGYTLVDGFIYRIEEQEPGRDGEPRPPKLHRLFYCKLDQFWAQKDPDVLHFRTTYDKGNFFKGHIKHEEMHSIGLGAALAKSKVKIYVDNKRFVEAFLVALLSKLHDEKIAQQTQPFGWYEESGLVRGFVFGGTLFKDDGGEAASGLSGSRFAQWYTASGELQPWLDACKAVTILKRPELEALIALSFASPLIKCAGLSGATLSAYGDSGTGKTFAMKIGLAVWGNFAKTLDQTNVTENSLMDKFGELRNLPTYWDEITSKTAQERAMNILFGQSGGVGKGRLTSDIEQREKGIWQSLMAISANISMQDYIVEKHKSHAGGINRILEYHVITKLQSTPGKLENVDADRLLDKLRTNHGVMGINYAKFLAMNYAAIDLEVRDTISQVRSELHGVDQDRFWLGIIGTLLVGAKYANHLGAELDEEALKTFLYKVFVDNRERRTVEMMQGGAKDNVEAAMTAYLKSRLGNNTIWTTRTPAVNGKTITTVLHGPDTNRSLRLEIQVRWDVTDRRLRISKRDFKIWLSENEYSTSATLLGMKDNYGMWEEKRKIGADTLYNVGQEHLLNIDVASGSDLEELMDMHSSRDPGAAAARVNEASDTGIGEAAAIRATEDAGRDVIREALGS
jgi:hypothetical protein